MRVTASDATPDELHADALVVVYLNSRTRAIPAALAPHLREDAEALLARANAPVWLETRGIPTPRVLFCAIEDNSPAWDPDLEFLGGHAGSFHQRDDGLTRQRTLRNLGATIERTCHAAGVSHAALLSWPEAYDPGLLIQGIGLRAHDPRAWEAHGGAPEASKASCSGLTQLSVCTSTDDPAEAAATAAALHEHVLVVNATNFARELADLPSNLGSAKDIVRRVSEHISRERVPLALSTISAREAAELGMGLFCAVDAGARERGCILRLEHRGASERAPVVLVGKGLTHDTGGYNLKRAGMDLLTYDKCGATAVIGAMIAIAHLDLPVNVVALCPLTENLVGSAAYKPGDILRACNGSTVYIENTDAEGRLVLGDVLAWLLQQEPRPELVIDMATLTGAVHLALGDPFAGLFCNEDRARKLLIEAGELSGELLWPMPIHEHHEAELGHHKADMRNVGPGPGSPSSAAAFLRHFVDYPWAHIDFAGKAHTQTARDCVGPGATGFGCRLLVEAIRLLS